MIIIKNIRDAKSEPCDEIWAIVRSMKSKSAGIEQVQDLSPTWDLFKKYRALKEQGDWNEQTFQEIYVPQFLRELKANRNAINLLNKLYSADKRGETICLVCFCPNEAMCHRSIIAGLLQGVGCDVRTETGADYSKYFTMFNNL